MNHEYVPASLAELYERQERIARKSHRHIKWLTISYFVGFIAFDVYLLWPVA